MLNLKNIYDKHLSDKYKDVIQNNKYISMHVYDDRTSLSSLILLAKSTQESDIITNYLTTDAVRNFKIMDYINWCNSHHVDFYFARPSYISIIKRTLYQPSFLKTYLNSLKYMKASKHYIHI